MAYFGKICFTFELLLHYSIVHSLITKRPIRLIPCCIIKARYRQGAFDSMKNCNNARLIAVDEDVLGTIQEP